MAVYKRSYKAYSGQMTPVWSRFTVLSKYGFATLFDSRIFTAFTVVCLIPFLVGIVLIYFAHSSTVQTLFNKDFSQILRIDNQYFYVFLFAEAQMGLILTAWAAPGMISKDFANHSIQLYLSRPLSRTEYLLGKISVLAALLSCITWIPLLLMFFLQAELEGHGWLGEHWWMAGSIVLSGLMFIALVSLISMAVSVWVRWRIAAMVLTLAVFFVLPGFGEAFDSILRTKWGRLVNFPYVLTVIWSQLFGLRLSPNGQLPSWSLWLSVLGVCVISLWLLNRRLRAREVERG